MIFNLKITAGIVFDSKVNQKSFHLIKKMIQTAQGNTHFKLELKFTFNYSTRELLLFPKNLHHSHQNPKAWNLNLGHSFREGIFVFQRVPEGVFATRVHFRLGALREDDLTIIKILKDFFGQRKETVNFLYSV